MLEVLRRQGAKLKVNLKQCGIQAGSTYCSINSVVSRSCHAASARGRQEDNTNFSLLDFSLGGLFHARPLKPT